MTCEPANVTIYWGDSAEIYQNFYTQLNLMSLVVTSKYVDTWGVTQAALGQLLQDSGDSHMSCTRAQAQRKERLGAREGILSSARHSLCLNFKHNTMLGCSCRWLSFAQHDTTHPAAITALLCSARHVPCPGLAPASHSPGGSAAKVASASCLASTCLCQDHFYLSTLIMHEHVLILVVVKANCKLIREQLRGIHSRHDFPVLSQLAHPIYCNIAAFCFAALLCKPQMTHRKWILRK